MTWNLVACTLLHAEDELGKRALWVFGEVEAIYYRVYGASLF